MSSDIVDAIDRALTDYGTSVDAMRWVPDVPESEPESLCRMCGGPCRWGYYAAPRTVLGPATALALAADWVIAQSGAVIALSGRALQASVTGNLSLVGVVNRDPPPGDPRERALHLRRTRNVGPGGRTPAGRKRRT